MGRTGTGRGMGRSGGASLVVVSLALTGCGGGDKNSAAEPAESASAAPSEASVPSIEPMDFQIDNEAEGPAPGIEGAEEGGVVRVVSKTDYSHLDPARIYINNAQNASNLFTRQLTTYRQQDGKVTLVGDLATNTGETKDKGKTWTFTLREGIKYEDGSAIKAQDIKYGIERTFVPDYTEGPTYIQEWLTGQVDFRKVYKGPYDGKSLDAISTPDDKTVVFKFKKPQPDMPFAASLPMTSPVKKSEDTKAKYDLKPFATGPYKISEHVVDKSLVLVRNKEWDPKTDPARHQYPDSYEFEFGPETLQQNQRLIASKGDDATMVPDVASVSAELVEQVLEDAKLKERTVEGYTQFVFRFDINNTRIKDFDVRKALLTAFPKQQLRVIEGGPSAGDFATTVSSPTLVGFKPYDLYKVPPSGDQPAAKKILEDAGKLNTKIVYAFPSTEKHQKMSVVIRDNLKRAGFDVVLKPLSDKNFYDETGKIDNPYDLYESGWGADWPSGSTVFPPTVDGTRIADQAPNYSHFNDPEINKEIERILGETDLTKAAEDWAALDKKVMEKIPFIPYLYDKSFQIYGDKIGGAIQDKILGVLRFDGLYVKKG